MILCSPRLSGTVKRHFQTIFENYDAKGGEGVGAMTLILA